MFSTSPSTLVGPPKSWKKYVNDELIACDYKEQGTTRKKLPLPTHNPSATVRALFGGYTKRKIGTVLRPKLLESAKALLDVLNKQKMGSLGYWQYAQQLYNEQAVA